MKKTLTKQMFLDIAEILDAWRIVPRILIGGYAWILYKVMDWYLHLEPHIPKEALNLVKEPQDLVNLIQDAPTNQHTALVTAVFGFGAAVFGLYTNSGRRWDGNKKTVVYPPEYTTSSNQTEL